MADDDGALPGAGTVVTLVDVVVVGGGIAGLVVARDVVAAGLSVVVLEAGPVTGGCVRVQRVAGLALDAGADSFATRTPAVARLAADLGLADDVVLPAPLGAWVQLPRTPGQRPVHGEPDLTGQAVPLPRTGLLGIPARPLAPDVRRAVGTAGSLRAALDRVIPGWVGVPAGPVSLGAVVRARMGVQVHDRLVAPVAGGVHATPPDLLDLDAVLPGVRRPGTRPGWGWSLGGAVGELRAAAPAGSAVAGIRGGLHRLVPALVGQVEAGGGEVRCGTPATGLRRVQNRGPARSGGRTVAVWEVATPAGPVRGRQVVVATPGPQAAALLGDLVEPPVREQPQDPVSLVTLVVDAPALDAAPRGTGVLVAASVNDVGAKALTHVSAKWAWAAQEAGPGVHALRLSYGRRGVEQPAAATADDDALVRAALRDATALLGVPLDRGRLRGSAVQRWSSGLPAAGPGHRAEVDRVRTALAAVGGVHAVGAWAAGTGLASVVADARRTADDAVHGARTS